MKNINNWFFGSIFRTLGRVVAYVLLAILVYYIFSWFNLPNVKAESFNATRFDVLTHQNDWGYQKNNVNSVFPTETGTMQGFEFFPLKADGTRQNIPIGEYAIDVQFGYTIQEDYDHTNVRSMFFITNAGGYIQGTCDGNQNQSYTYGGFDVTLGYIYNVHYTCDKLIVNQNFTSYMFRAMLPYKYGTYLYITNVTFRDLNSTNDTDRIINNFNSTINNGVNTITNNQNQNTQTIVESQEENTEAINELNESITSEDEPDVDLFSGIESLMPIDTPITDIITLPINVLNKTITGLGGTCQSWTINSGELLGEHDITIPCLNISQYFTDFTYGGYNLWQIIDLMICFFMGYEIIMLIISAYNSIVNLDDTFDVLYQPRHANNGYVPKHGGGN